MDIVALKETIRRSCRACCARIRACVSIFWNSRGENIRAALKTEDRFYQLLGELRRDREEQTRKWEEQNRKWDEQQEEQNRPVGRSPAPAQGGIRAPARGDHELAKRHDRAWRRLGARWWTQSEKAFREAWRAFWKRILGCRWSTSTSMTIRARCFGRPDQVGVGRDHQERPAVDLRVEVIHRQGGDVCVRAQGAVLREAPSAASKPADRDFADGRRSARQVAETAGDRGVRDSVEVERL